MTPLPDAVPIIEIPFTTEAVLVSTFSTGFVAPFAPIASAVPDVDVPVTVELAESVVKPPAPQTILVAVILPNLLPVIMIERAIKLLSYAVYEAV